MAGAQDEQREDYVVRVIEFAADTANAVRALQRVFGLSETDAAAMVREAPVAVKRGVNRIRAEYLRRALELSGARVEVQTGEGTVVAAGTTAEAAAAPPLMAAVAGAPKPLAPAAPRLAPPPTAAGAPARPSSGPVSPFGKTLLMGTQTAPSAGLPANKPANDVAPAAPAAPAAAAAPAAKGWGDLEPLKKPAAEARAPRPDPAPGATRRESPAAAFSVGGPRELSANDIPKSPPFNGAAAFAPGGPRELSESDIPQAPQFNAGAAFAPGGPRELSVSDMPSSASLELSTSLPAAAMPNSPVELSTSDLPQGPALELGGEERELRPFAPPKVRDARARERESTPRDPTPRDAIPAGERWKAPGSDTLARARRKQAVHSLESGLADSAPAPAAAPAAPARVAGIARNTPGTPVQAVSRPKTQSVGRAADGFGEVTALAFAGKGFSWMAWIALSSLAFAGAGELLRHVPLAGGAAVLLILTVMLALCGWYHRRVVWAAATGDEVEDGPAVAPVDWLRAGAPLLLFAGLIQLLVWARVVSDVSGGRDALAVVSSPIVWVLGIGPGFYWSIALGCAAAHNRFRAIWNVSQGLRALGREPGEIARVAVASGAAFALTLTVATFVLSLVGLSGPGALFGAGGLALAISHGLMGAWTGRLLRVRPDLFE